MNWLVPSIIASLTAGVCLIAAYIYLYLLDREKYLGIWAWSWVIYFFRFVFMLLMLAFEGLSPVFLSLNQAASLASGILLFRGTCEFSGKPFSRYWYVLAAADLGWIAATAVFGFSLTVVSLPTFFLLAAVYVWTGIRIMKMPGQNSVSLTIGITFLLWGAHKANYPLLRPVAWFAPWGYLIAALLSFTVAFGIILLYFQKNRRDLIENERKYRELVESFGAARQAVREAVWNMRESSDIVHVGATMFAALTEQNIRFDNFGIQVFPDYPDTSVFEAYIVDRYGEWTRLGQAEGAPTVAEFVRNGVTVYRRDVTVHDEFGESSLLNDMYRGRIRSVVDVPFSHGTIALNSTEPNAYDDEEIGLLEEHAKVLSEGYRRFGDLQNIENRTRALEAEIAERKRAEEELARSEEKFRTLVENMPETVCEFDLEGIITYVSRRGFEYFGYTEEDVERGINIHDMVAPEDKERARENVEMIVRGEKTGSSEYHLFRRNGSEADVLIHSNLIVRNGAPAGIRSIIVDITEIKRTEAALREAVLKQKEAVKAANVGLWDWDLLTNRVTYSPEWKRQIGYGEDEIEDDYREWERRVHPDDLEKTVVKVRTSIEKRDHYHQSEFRFRHKDGSYRWILARGSVLQDESGRAVRMLGSHIDITDRKRAEEQIERSLREKVVLLNEVHHRVKNNLQVMVSLLRLQAEQAAGEEARHSLDESINRLSTMSMVHALLYQSENVETVDFHRMAEDLFQNLRNLYGVTVRFVNAVGNVSLGLDTAIPCGLILNELVSNAFKHAFPGDREGVITVEMNRCGKDAFELRVSDDGVGISPSVDMEQASTLGLRIVGGLTRQLDGTVGIERDGGTTFVLRLREREGG